MYRLVEYVPTRVELADEDLTYLLDLVKSSDEDEGAKLFESLTPTRTSGEYVIRSGPYVGRLGLPNGSHVDLVSRFDLPDVLELIRRSARAPIRLDAMRIPTDSADSLIDVIATAFARELERLVAGGLAKAYMRRSFERPPFPGAIDVTRHLARSSARPDRLVTTANRLTRDIDVNRALVAALEVLRRVPLAAPATSRVARVAAAFREVRLVPFSADRVRSLRLTPATLRYAEALSLAEVILRSQSLAPRLETNSGASIVYSMPKIWETYVAQAVRAAWPQDFDVEHGHWFDLTPGGGFPSEADVVVRLETEVVALYDAKYKWSDRAPARDDIYQMVTYCERLGLDTATLVYPAPEPVQRWEAVGRRRIWVVGLEGPGWSEPSVGHLVTSEFLQVRSFLTRGDDRVA